MMSPDDDSINVQGRISAFEALSLKKPINAGGSKSAPNLLDTPLSPKAISISPIVPSISTPTKSPVSVSPSPSPPILGRKTSLIDLKDWVMDDDIVPSAPRQKQQISNARPANTALVTPLIHLESSPPKAKPPLPPRKSSSYNSLQSISTSDSSSSSLGRSPNTPNATLPPQLLRKKSDSLTVDHTYPPLGIKIPAGRNGPGHVPASSISSFHSVSLSSDGGNDPMTPGSLSNFVATYPVDQESDRHSETTRESDTVSLADSFEHLSVSSAISPSIPSVDWPERLRRPEPPKLPFGPKPSSTINSSSSSMIPVTYAIRPPSVRPTPPPPPPRIRPTPPSNRSSLASTITSASDRSSIISNATSRTSVSSVRPNLLAKTGEAASQLARPTPIPTVARRRYEMVFVGNVLAQRRTAAFALERAISPPPGRKARQAAGWRGLSVDLVTNPGEHPVGKLAGHSGAEEVGSEERLNGKIVAIIWKTSRLDQNKLKDIWSDCDVDRKGSLDRDQFARGMWRIDEELRKAQLSLRSPSSQQPKRLNSIFR